MNLKGEYSGLTSYSVGDVVRYTDGIIYALRKPCPSGTPPTNTLFWERLEQIKASDILEMVFDAIDLSEAGALHGKVANNLTTTASGKILDARQGKTLKGLIDDQAQLFDTLNPDGKTIVLDSSTASSTKKFAITVDDDGELTAAEIVAGGDS